MSLLIAILHFRESEFNDLEANEDTDTNYDLTEADLHVVKHEIYEEECDPQLEAYVDTITYVVQTNAIASDLIKTTTSSSQ